MTCQETKFWEWPMIIVGGVIVTLIIWPFALWRFGVSDLTRDRIFGVWLAVLLWAAVIGLYEVATP